MYAQVTIIVRELLCCVIDVRIVTVPLSSWLFVYQGNSGDPNMPVEWKPREYIGVLSRILILGGE